MDRSTQLQFQRLPVEAQRAALWRLALSGLTAEQVAERTGLTTEQVRRVVSAAVQGGTHESASNRPNRLKAASPRETRA